MIKKYRNKPVIREAVQWTGKNIDEIYSFCGAENIGPIERRPDYDLKIKTLESGDGHHIVCKGDYIIKGIKGEFYPVKEDIFLMSYERVEDAT